MPSDQDLLHGDPKLVAAFLGITPRQLNNYKSGKTPLPPACRKLLQLRLGDLRALGGDAWDGFHFGRDGLLYLPGWANGWTPESIRALFFNVQEVAALRQEVRKLRAECWALRKVQTLTAAPVPLKVDRRRA